MGIKEKQALHAKVYRDFDFQARVVDDFADPCDCCTLLCYLNHMYSSFISSVVILKYDQTLLWILFSPNRSSLLARGRPIGRSASLNHGPSNPAQSKAGQVPWVRLKRRESVALADIVKGRSTHSPNTIKIAAPEPSHLLPAPRYDGFTFEKQFNPLIISLLWA